VPAAAVTAAAAVAIRSVDLNDEKPDFSRNVSIHQARSQKIFGTVKSFKINPNARPKIPIYDEPAQAAPIIAPTPVYAPTPVAVQVTDQILTVNN